ncbi:TPA: hypothetical protein ACH0PD_000291 [Legionella pneumophila]
MLYTTFDNNSTIAYAKLQFTNMSNSERAELRNALLRYCELDTLAMVMIIEGWQHMLQLSEIHQQK